MRIYHPLRQVFGVFDKADVNSDEREVSNNVESFKECVSQMIQERREELQQPGCNTKN